MRNNDVTNADREAAAMLADFLYEKCAFDLTWNDRIEMAGIFVKDFAAHRRRERERIVGMVEAETDRVREEAKTADDRIGLDLDCERRGFERLLRILKHQLESEA